MYVHFCTHAERLVTDGATLFAGGCFKVDPGKNGGNLLEVSQNLPIPLFFKRFLDPWPTFRTIGWSQLPSLGISSASQTRSLVSALGTGCAYARAARNLTQERSTGRTGLLDTGYAWLAVRLRLPFIADVGSTDGEVVASSLERPS